MPWCVCGLFRRRGLEKRVRNIVLNSLHSRRKVFASLGRDYNTSGSFLKMAERNRLVWVDLEMTGLDVEKDHILEMACIITDEHLNIVKEGPCLVIHHPQEVVDGMDEWCVKQHGKTGLTKAVQQSTISLPQAEEIMVTFVKGHTPEGRCPLAGNSIHCDKSFLDKHMKRFMAHLHYRIVDVSTVKELCRRWYPEEFYDAPKKLGSHRASADIHQSIEELKYYWETIFK